MLNENVSVAEREMKETNVYGYSWTPWSIIISKKIDIDVASSIMFDWVHTYVCDGLGDNEFGVFMKRMHRAITQEGMVHSCTYATLKEYLSGWTWPKDGANPMHLFDETRAKRFINSGNFACTASEFLTLGPIINRFLKRVVLEQVVGTHAEKHVASMIANLDVIDLLKACKVKDAVAPETLHTAIQNHLDCFKATYGESDMRPKHHYALHLANMLARFGILVGTLTHERKHRAVKRYSKGRTNGLKFETSVLEEVTCHNIWELGEKQWLAFSTSMPSRRQKWCLEVLFADEPGDVRFTLHTKVHANGYITRGDIVTFMSNGNMCIGELQINVGLATDASCKMVSIVSKWEHGPTDGEFVECGVRDESMHIPTMDLISPLAYRMSADRKTCVVVMPYELRGAFRASQIRA